MDIWILVILFAVHFAGWLFVVTKVVVREVPDNQRAAVFRRGSFLRLGGRDGWR